MHKKEKEILQYQIGARFDICTGDYYFLVNQ